MRGHSERESGGIEGGMWQQREKEKACNYLQKFDIPSISTEPSDIAN